MNTTIHHATSSATIDWYGSITIDQHDGHVADIVTTDPAVRDLATVARNIGWRIE